MEDENKNIDDAIKRLVELFLTQARTYEREKNAELTDKNKNHDQA